jgi:hypothetical protein
MKFMMGSDNYRDRRRATAAFVLVSDLSVLLVQRFGVTSRAERQATTKKFNVFAQCESAFGHRRAGYRPSLWIASM